MRKYIKGVLYQQTKGNIEAENEQIDIYFLKRHFEVIYYLPEKLTDKKFSGQTISLWENPNDKKEFTSNRTYTYTYDSLGRMINFAYSSCIVCATLPYNYTIVYNSKSQVEVIRHENKAEDRYKFYYNKKGDIIKFEEYAGDKIAMEITLSDRKCRLLHIF
ncbi:hypothetical protein L3C95_29725 [Chitinophaga filiformis]|uniref:hypothetical protein n=1 Tax=Chitinophaga filiformis TaxID=104663 RepID=UPI001F265976|nr:hypothetical protein [Chitinophaga filiformis]MCF6407112.1 hypothetical protein [Chitinophaga filiformis]